MRLYPNCKINLGLRVVRRRADGYHDLETVFYPVYGLCDVLDVECADTFCFEQSGLAIDCAPKDNLLLRCYRLMQNCFSQVNNVHIRFDKRIPFGAGLGGGSSDAAHIALALNQLFNLGLSREQLSDIVRPLGADCPFFLYNTPCLAEGIGDQLTPVSLSLEGMRILMLKPSYGVSTREAYGGLQLDENRTDHPNSLFRLCKDKLPIPWKDCLVENDFEQTVFALHPDLAVLKQRLLDAGAICAGMSGSGSTVFGLFENDAKGRSRTGLSTLQEEFASMIIFDDTL